MLRKNKYALGFPAAAFPDNPLGGDVEWQGSVTLCVATGVTAYCISAVIMKNCTHEHC